MATKIEATGPLFDGRAARAAHDFCVTFAEGYGDDVEQELKHMFPFKHPTGYYASRVQSHRSGEGQSTVDDGGVVYGPWLEGVGSRNQTTRFKGYFTFRKTAQVMDRRAKVEANRMFKRFLGRMQ